MAGTSWIGETLNGRYQIQELLGKGGMSAVYKANDPNLRRVVAIKIIHQHLSGDPEFVYRFEEEAAAVAQLRHPNLIQVFDFNNDSGTYYIVFEFVAGETVQDRLKRLKQANRPMDIDEVVDIAANSAEGLHYAHNKGLIHRDIKPANIIINVQGNPIVTDFGIAKIMGGTQHTATGAVLGTARYMSPEQIKGDHIDPRTDIYSLGVTMFEMLGGRPPFEADSAMTLMMMHMTDPVPDLSKIRADIPPALAAVVQKSLAKDRNDRYQTGMDLAAALRNAVKPGAAPPVKAAVAAIPLTKPPDPEVTVLEPLPEELETPRVGVAAATGTAAATSGARTTQPVAGTPPPAQQAGGSRTLLYGAGAVILLLLIGFGVWAAFLRNPAPQEQVAGGEIIPTETREPTEEPDFAATQEAINVGVAAQVETRIAAGATQTAEALAGLPTSTSEPSPTPSSTPEDTAAEAPVVESDATVDWFSGEVFVHAAGDVLVPLTQDTPIVEGTDFFTGADGQMLLSLADGSTVQMAENSNFRLDKVADNPVDYSQQSVFTLIEGDILLQQPRAGNELVVMSQSLYTLATLQNTAQANSKSPALARRAQQNTSQAAMSVGFTNPQRIYISCFVGRCTTGSGSSLAAGWEKVITVEGGFINTYPISTATPSYQQWQTACENCLPLAPAPVRPTATPVPPTATTAPTRAATVTVTGTYLAPTATMVATSEASPTTEGTPTAAATEEASYFVQITGITLENGVYVVNYATSGYTEQLPGRHVHFYFDTVPESQAGVPGNGPWKLYGGPRPFTQYTEADRPAGATSMCARVANEDHSILPGTGNCYPLP